MLTILAPAKINLTLEVLAKRRDGFHEIRSVIQTIDLCDSLYFQLGQGIAFNSDEPGWIAESSLVSKAASVLRQATGCTKGATIDVKKRIPLVSGLGGDSSDAAAVLRGLNQLWELGLSLEELLGLAKQLGSDVAYFLYGGTALVEGRGELVTPLPLFPHMWVVLAIPPTPSVAEKTKQLYASLKANHYTDGQITQRMVMELSEGCDFSPSLLFNTFENVAFDYFKGLDIVKSHMVKMGAPVVHLAGSGPALFTLVKERDQAEGLFLQLRQQKLESYMTETIATIEKVQ